MCVKVKAMRKMRTFVVRFGYFKVKPELKGGETSKEGS